MIHSFYFRFYKITHCDYLSIILARLAYLFFSVKFLCEKLLHKKKIVDGDIGEALEKIASVHYKETAEQKIVHTELNPELDLSIIVPVYNYAPLIREMIESILGQKTQFRYELILVDDGSTDGAREIVTSYASVPNVKVICQANQGIAGARNTGLDNASGRYIMFVDCDDTVTDRIVETLMSKAVSEDCDIVMCAHDLVRQSNGEITSVLPNIHTKKNLFGYCENAGILNYAGLPWCKVYKRELWENVRFFRGFWYEDTIIHSLIFTQCRRFEYIPEVCYKYRWYENNFSHIQGKKTDVRCIDYYYLMTAILRKADELQITDTDCFYTMLLNHLCAYFYKKVQGMDEAVLEALFITCRDILKKYRPNHKVKLPYVMRTAEKALVEGDMNLWILASNYQ